jgi:hypothetical protein
VIANFSIAVYLLIIVSPLNTIYPPITIYSSVIICPFVTIGLLVIIISDSIKGKQILTSHILAESQWITFQYSMDCHIVICQAQLVLQGVL